MYLKDILLSVLYPRHCPVCHRVMALGQGLICLSCRQKVAFVEEPVCFRCGKGIASREIEYCYDCSRHPRSFCRGFALAVYDPIMRESIRRFKNGGRMEYADWYGEELWTRYGEQLTRIGADLLVPVPLHRSRQRERGYNQAELLARSLSRKMGVPVASGALIRPRKTTAQKYLGAGDRSRNLEAAFAPGRQAVEGAVILLVDDIYTTGGTAEACTRVLLQMGARAVYLVNVCIGENDG